MDYTNKGIKELLERINGRKNAERCVDIRNMTLSDYINTYHEDKPFGINKLLCKEVERPLTNVEMRELLLILRANYLIK